MKSHIKLIGPEIIHASNLASEAVCKYAGAQGHYGTVDGKGWNTFRRHFVGKLGEVAVYKMMAKIPYTVLPYFQMKLLDAYEDLRVSGSGWHIRIEVKTWSTGTWKAQGRCINQKQMKSIMLHRDMVIWCRSHHPPIYKPEQVSAGPIAIDLMGFSLICDLPDMVLRDTGSEDLNYQLDEPQMRGIERLKQAFVSFALSSTFPTPRANNESPA